MYVSEIRHCLPTFVSVISSLDRCLRNGSKFTLRNNRPTERSVCVCVCGVRVCVCRYCRYSTYICGSLDSQHVRECGGMLMQLLCLYRYRSVSVCVCTPKVCASVCLGGVTCPSGSQ